MLPRLQHQLDRLEARRLTLLRELGALAPEQRAFHPSPAAWSPSEVAQHLSLVDARVTRVLTERRVSGVTRRRARDVIGLAPLLRLYFVARWRSKMPVKGVALG